MDIHEALKRYPHYSTGGVVAVATPDGLLLQLRAGADGITLRRLTCDEDFAWLHSALNAASIPQGDREQVYFLFHKAVAERVGIDQDRAQAWRVAGDLRKELSDARVEIERLRADKDAAAPCPIDGMQPITADAPFYHGPYLVWRPGMAAPIEADRSNKGWRDHNERGLGVFTHWRARGALYITSWSTAERSWVAAGKVRGYDFHARASGGAWRLTVHARTESGSVVVCELGACHPTAETFDRPRVDDLLHGAVPAIMAALAAQGRPPENPNPGTP